VSASWGDEANLTELLLTNPSQIKSMKAEAGARLAEAPRGAVNVRARPLKMTATLKRRALRKKPLAIAAQSMIE
jgi:hypothetical protein